MVPTPGFLNRFFAWFFHFLNPPGFSLTQRILSFACLLTFLLSICALIVNLSLKMPVLLLGLNMVMILTYMLLYLQSRRGRTDTIAFAYVYISLLILFGVWLPNGGITGSTPLFCTWLLALGCFVLPHKQLLVFICLFIFSVSTLYILELRFPDWVIAYTSVQQQKLDLFFSLIFILVLFGLCLFIFRLLQASEARVVQNAL